MKKYWLIGAAAAAMLMVMSPKTVFAGQTRYVSGDMVNLRSAGSFEGAVLESLPRNTQVEVLEQGPEWSKISVQGSVGYMATRYLAAEKVAEPQPLPAAVQTQTVTVSGQAAPEGSYRERVEVPFRSDWQYGSFSRINSGSAVLYRTAAVPRGHVICVNAGHGTSGGGKVKTQCHPDGSPKVTGGSTAEGATTATAIASGMDFADGTPENKVTLRMALIFRDKLLAEGYDVLMIREGNDVQLDNIARTVLANNMADCHIALHWDSTSSDKGAFYMSVPNSSRYRSMEPVASHWQEHNRLGESLIAGLRNAGVKIFSSGQMEMDLTQTSYSTVPSVDIELGDKKSDYSDSSLNRLADGLVAGVHTFFQ